MTTCPALTSTVGRWRRAARLLAVDDSGRVPAHSLSVAGERGQCVLLLLTGSTMTECGRRSGDHRSSSGCKRARNGENKVTVALGAQWGDEGKGKVVDLLATDADIVCRCQVSAAGVGNTVGCPSKPG